MSDAPDIITLQSRLEEAQRAEDALHARLASAEAKVRELECDNNGLRLGTEHFPRMLKTAEARLRVVTEALETMKSGAKVLSGAVSGGLAKDFADSFLAGIEKALHATRSADLPSAEQIEELSAVSPGRHPIEGTPVEPCPHCIGTGIKPADLPPHPDTERLDWLEARSTPKLGWIARQSNMGRGYRLHQDQFAQWPTARAAIDAARAQAGKEAGR